MAFNHYAKIKRILDGEAAGWYIKRINESTTAKSFKGEIRTFDHYYRIYSADGNPIKYCKFQQLDLFIRTVGIAIDDLPLIDES